MADDEEFTGVVRIFSGVMKTFHGVMKTCNGVIKTLMGGWGGGGDGDIQ